jgi:hypothetical protein
METLNWIAVVACVGGCVGQPEKAGADTTGLIDTAEGSARPGFDPNGVWEVLPLESLSGSWVSGDIAYGGPRGMLLVWGALIVEGHPRTPTGEEGSWAYSEVAQTFSSAWLAELGEPDSWSSFEVFPSRLRDRPLGIRSEWSVDDDASLILVMQSYYTSSDDIIWVETLLECKPADPDRLRCRWLPADSGGLPAPYIHLVLVRRPSDWLPRPMTHFRGMEAILLAKETL